MFFDDFGVMEFRPIPNLKILRRFEEGKELDTNWTQDQEGVFRTVIAEEKSSSCKKNEGDKGPFRNCLLYTSPSPRDQRGSRMPSSA